MQCSRANGNSTGNQHTVIDPDKERKPPPEHNTVVFFPQNHVELTGTDGWLEHTPKLSRHFIRINNPLQITKNHLAALNFTAHNDEQLEAFVPGGLLPPPFWMSCAKTPLRKLGNEDRKAQYLSNGVKAPDPESFVKYARELVCDTEDAFRALGHLKPRPGHTAPHLNHFRDFWTSLETMAQYWDTSQDHYIEKASVSAPPSPIKTKSKAKSFFSLSSLKSPHPENLKPTPDLAAEATTTKVYKGRRTASAQQMPEQVRKDLVRSFVRTVVNLFECQAPIPRKEISLEIGPLLIPTSYVGQAWRLPGHKEAHKYGWVDGPILGISARPELQFVTDIRQAHLDIGREMAALLLQAEQRAREGKPRLLYGEGQWWTSSRRWGGGPGGQFGEGEMEQGFKPPTTTRKANFDNAYMPVKSDEDIWRELRPAGSGWEEKKTYLAVGKDRSAPEDTVCSSLPPA